SGFYKTIIDTLKDEATIPILIHGYDHPIPDGRGILGLSDPWLEPVFAKRGYDICNKPADKTLATDVMRFLIDRLNAMVANVAASYPNRVYPVNLTGTLAAHYGTPDKYQLLWANELHPNDEGFDLLGALIVNKLKQLKVG